MSLHRTIRSGVVGITANAMVEVPEAKFTGQPPIMSTVQNLSGDVVILAAYKDGVHGGLLSTTSTAVTAEATGYTGNASTLAFTGQSLNNVPIQPKSVTLTPATSGVALIDGGDGKFYTSDTDLDEAGTIDYFTGAITLAYPTGKAPDGAISAAYKYEDETVTVGGRKTFIWESLGPLETFVLVAVAKQGTASASKAEIATTYSGAASGSL